MNVFGSNIDNWPGLSSLLLKDETRKRIQALSDTPWPGLKLVNSMVEPWAQAIFNRWVNDGRLPGHPEPATVEQLRTYVLEETRRRS